MRPFDPKTKGKLEITISEEEINSRPDDAILGRFVKSKLHDLKSGIFESCLLCGRLSPYTKDTHVSLRRGYILGAGQGCFEELGCVEAKGTINPEE